MLFQKERFFFIYSPITYLTYQFTFLICYSFSSKDYLIGARFDGNGYIQYAMGNFSLLTDFQIKIRLRTFQTNTSIFVVQSNTSVSRGFCHPNRKSEKKTTGLLFPISFRKYPDQKNAVPQIVWRNHTFEVASKSNCCDFFHFLSPVGTASFPGPLLRRKLGPTFLHATLQYMCNVLKPFITIFVQFQLTRKIFWPNISCNNQRYEQVN